MFPGKEKFEFGYDLLRHSAFMHRTWDCNRGFQEVQIKYEISGGNVEARFRLKWLFYNKKKGTKVKIKTIQYSALISYRYCIRFCIREVFLTSWAWASTEESKREPWPANVFFNKHSCIQLISSTIAVLLLRWSTFRGRGDLGQVGSWYKAFRTKTGWNFLKR